MSIPIDISAGNQTCHNDLLERAATVPPTGVRISAARLWTGRVLSGLVVASCFSTA